MDIFASTSADTIDEAANDLASDIIDAVFDAYPDNQDAHDMLEALYVELGFARDGVAEDLSRAEAD